MNMQPFLRRPLIVFLLLAAAPLAGCLFKPKAAATRQFILAAISTNEPAADATNSASVAIGFIKMPAYLLRDTLVIRKDTHEITCLEDALWAERLDQNFRSALAANLSKLLPADTVYLADWGHDLQSVGLSVDVQEFDVDLEGRGKLIAQWRLKSPGRQSLNQGQISVSRLGASPRGHPEVIAVTMSALLGEFSRELAQSINQSVTSGP